LRAAKSKAAKVGAKREEATKEKALRNVAEQKKSTSQYTNLTTLREVGVSKKR
jgi:hypothetical protein